MREVTSVSRLVVNDHLDDHGLATGAVALTRQWYVVAGSRVGIRAELALVVSSNPLGTEEKSVS